jgi:hypothetical protein
MRNSDRTILVVFSAIFALALQTVLGVIGGLTIRELLRGVWSAGPIMYPSGVSTPFLYASVALAIAGALSVVLVFWRPWPSAFKKTILYWIVLAVLLPLSCVNLAYSYGYMNIKSQAILDFALVVFGTTAVSQLYRVPISDTFLRVLRGSIVFVVGLLAIVIPGIYGTLYLCYIMNFFNANLVNDQAITAVTGIAALGVSYLSYRLELSKVKEAVAKAA